MEPFADPGILTYGESEKDIPGGEVEKVVWLYERCVVVSGYRRITVIISNTSLNQRRMGIVELDPQPLCSFPLN